jgi:hypothetical protein
VGELWRLAVPRRAHTRTAELAVAMVAQLYASVETEGRRWREWAAGREAVARGAFTSASMVQPRRVETTRRWTPEDGRPRCEFNL